MMIGMSIGSILGLALGLGAMATVQSTEDLQEEQLMKRSWLVMGMHSEDWLKPISPAFTISFMGWFTIVTMHWS